MPAYISDFQIPLYKTITVAGVASGQLCAPQNSGEALVIESFWAYFHGTAGGGDLSLNLAASGVATFAHWSPNTLGNKEDKQWPYLFIVQFPTAISVASTSGTFDVHCSGWIIPDQSGVPIN